MSAKKPIDEQEAPVANSVGARLVEFMNENNMFPAIIARATQSHPSTVASYLRNETSPKKAWLKKLSEKFNVNPAWIEYGVAPKYLGPCDPKCDAVVHEPASTDYERECLRLQHELAAKDREAATKDRSLAALELAMGRQQGRIFEAIRIICGRLGISDENTRILQVAVMDYESVLAEDCADAAKLHQKAAGV